jgi:putative ABC transport system permease protein
MPRTPRPPGLSPGVRRPEDHVERDVEDEIAFHLESRVTELIARGQPEDAARRHAEVEFGDLRASRRELAAVDRHRRRRERVTQWLDAAAHDLRQAVRSLGRSPAFTIPATLALAIGIGSSAAIFAVVYGVLLRPLPYGHPDRLVGAWHDLEAYGMMRVEQTVSTYYTYRQLAHTIEGIGVYREGEVNVAEPGAAGQPQRVISASISATLTPVLEVAPILGRAFTDADDRRGAPPVVLVDEGLWRTRFGADPGILGHRLDVNGVSREIVGVMPARFRFPAPATQLWIPIQLDPLDPPGAGFEYGAVARLKPGVTIAEAERDFGVVLPRAAEIVPKFVSGLSTQQIMNQVRPKPSLVPLRDDVTGKIAGTLWMVAAAAALVLLVASANVANLTLVRADAHQREVAVREALGAGRGRMMLHVFAESAVVAAGAAVLGLGAAAMVVRSLVGAGPAGIPRLTEVRIDAGTVLFTLAITALVAVACGIFPASRVGRARLPLGRASSRGGTALRTQHRLRGGLVAAQIALGLVVLAGSGLLLRTFVRLHAVHPGFEPERVSTFWVYVPAARLQDEAAVVGFYARLVDRVSALPGVEVVGLTSHVPLELHGGDQNPLYPEDDASYATRLPPLEIFAATNGDYFRAMGIPLLAGRTFDRLDSQREGDAIVSRSTAQFFWKDSTGVAALGKRFRPLPTSRLYTVIGVVGDTVDTALADPPSRAVYVPETAEAGGGFLQTRRGMALVVRTTDERTPIASDVRRAVRDLDPTLPTFDVRSMTAVLSAATAQLTFVILILGGAATATLILGAVGLYGVLAYVVALRRRELGIRMALGASPWAVAGAIARYGLALAGIGIVLGLAIFAVVARFLGAQLFGVSASDPATLGGSALMLVAIALLASWAPARRAARVAPADALRAE